MKVLITAGPTRVQIDDIRYVSTVFSGQTGYDIAKHFAENGAKVTLLLGPGNVIRERINNLKIVDFVYFEDLQKELSAQFKKNKFDVFIHTAAVADYLPEKIVTGKIPSGKSGFTIKFKKAPKLIEECKAISSPKTVFVQFKLESNVSKTSLLERANVSLKKNLADYVVANDFADLTYNQKLRFIADKNGQLLKICKTQKELNRELYSLLA